MNLIQLLLLPLSFIYQLVLRLRNSLYTHGIFGVTSFDLPIINVGNLAFGGTGKTPHIEYLIRLLKDSYKVAVLSRGYKRKTTGYLFGDQQATAMSLGDEPYQIFRKFREIEVAVSENRVLGVPNLLFDAPETEVILLDDAYQHRAIKPGLNILLTEQNSLYVNDHLAPAGYLREYASAAERANCIVVTKCKTDLSLEERKSIIAQLKPLGHQSVYFSYLKYGELVPYFEPLVHNETTAVIAFAGIANPLPFFQYIESKYQHVITKSFPDHHQLSEIEIERLLETFDEINSDHKIFVSTEKDFQKLVQGPQAEKLKKYPFYYIPIEVAFFADDSSNFNQKVIHYVSENSPNTYIP